jgi:hypothetical protein
MSFTSFSATNHQITEIAEAFGQMYFSVIMYLYGNKTEIPYKFVFAG